MLKVKIFHFLNSEVDAHSLNTKATVQHPTCNSVFFVFLCKCIGCRVEKDELLAMEKTSVVECAVSKVEFTG